MSSAQLERATASEPGSSKTWLKLQEHRRIFLPQLVSCQMLIIGNPADVSGVVRHPTRFRTYQLMAARCGGRPPGRAIPEPCISAAGFTNTSQHPSLLGPRKPCTITNHNAVF